MELDIGIDQKHREQIAEGLSRLLADSYTLYLKTHNYHWNVTGPQFNTLHTDVRDSSTPNSRSRSMRSRSEFVRLALRRRDRTPRSPS